MTRSPHAYSSQVPSEAADAQASAPPVVVSAARRAGEIPPPVLVEIAFYLVLIYGVWSPGLGLAVPMLGSLSLMALAGICVLWLGPHTPVFSTVQLPIACAATFLAIHVFAHGGTVTDATSRSFITWSFSLFIVGALSIRRNFMQRCVLVLFGIGVSVLPYLTYTYTGRAEIDSLMVSGDFNHTNGLGAWFAFICLWYTILATETRRVSVRAFAITAALISLYVVGLTVSRGAILGIAVGTTFAFRRLLGRGFAAVLASVVVIGSVLLSGAFDDVIAQYAARSDEDTARLAIWPPALQRILESPWVGVGANDVRTYVESRRNVLTPHNTFLWFGLAAGIVPFLLFTAWWIKAARKAFFSDERTFYGAYRVPLLMLSLVASLLGDLEIMQTWGVITFCLVMAPATPYGVRRFVLQRSSPPAGLTPATAEK